MQHTLFTTMSLGLCTLLLASGCQKQDDQPPPNTAAYPPQQGYGQPAGYQQQPAGYQQQPGSYQQQQQPGTTPQQQPGAYPQPAQTAQPAATAATGSPPPSPIATACKADADCIGARCNLQAQKCQFPCGSNTDCQTGWACTLGACMMTGNIQPH
jgi:hypothetical protein